MSLPTTMITAIRQALVGTGSWYEIYSRIRKAVPDGEEEAYRGVVWAFGFDLIAPGDADRREREGSPFGAMFEFDGKRLPPRLEDVPNADVESWVSAYEAIDDPRLRARMGDLLWERKHPPRPDEKARAACCALVALTRDSQWEPMASADGLVRALDIAKSLSDDALSNKVATAMVETIEDELASEHDRPGIPFSLLTPLVDLPEDSRPSNLEELLSRAETKYGNDPHHAEAALDLKVQISSPGETSELRRRQVDTWRNAAAKSDGLVRLTFLERALDVARTHRLVDEAKDLRVELGAITEKDLNLKEVSADIEVDSEQLEQHLASLVKFKTWEESLARFGIHGPPGGEPTHLEEQLSQQMQDTPFQFLVTKVILDPDSGAAVFRATDALTHKTAATAQQRLLASRIWGAFAVDVLQRLETKYGRPGQDELTRFFTAAFIEEAVAERIARAFELWWDGQPDESAHLIAPRLETIIREIARRMGLPVIREPIADKPGGVRSLGDLLHALNGRLPTAGWHAYLFNLLSDPLGLNLRNVIGHGMRTRISVDDAALLLHTACYLRLIAPERAEPQQPAPAN